MADNVMKQAFLTQANQIASKLSPEELVSLKALTMELLAPTIPGDHAVKLVSLGLAKQKHGVFAPTMRGRLVIL